MSVSLYQCVTSCFCICISLSTVTAPPLIATSPESEIIFLEDDASFGVQAIETTIFETERLVDVTDSWKYEVSGSDLGTNWREPDYVDSSWPSGGGLLYVETSDLPAPKTTALPLIAKSLPTTCYFRTTFDIDLEGAESLSLIANTIVDDGVVLYLNGTEILRNRMNGGTVAFDTFALSVGDAVLEGPFEIDTGSLVDGLNVLAAEVHQTKATSSDIVMGLTLDVTRETSDLDQVAPTILSQNPAVNGRVTSSTLIQIVFDESVVGVDAADLLINGIPASSVVANSAANYLFSFSAPTEGWVSVSWANSHGITDTSAAQNAFSATSFTYAYGTVSTIQQLDFSKVFQSSEGDDGRTADQAVDDSTRSYSLTADLAGSFWQAEFERSFELERLEIVNRSEPVDVEMDGLRLSLVNMDDQTVYETILTNPGSRGTSVIDLPAGTLARTLRIELPDGSVNGAGNYQIGLAEVRAFGEAAIPFSPVPVALDDPLPAATVNLASGKRSFMLRIADTDAPSSNVNDGDITTEARTTSNAFDGYWEVDLGATYALYGIRAITPDDLQERLGYTIARLYDDDHNSVHSQKVTGASNVYDIDLGGPIFARYVRIGLEDKTRPNETNTTNQFEIGLLEVEVFGRPTSEVGVLSFTTSDEVIASAQDVTLDWSVEDVESVDIHPSIGSVGSSTAANWIGTLDHPVSSSTEFLLVARNDAGIFSEAVGVEVDGVPLSVRISEVLADNKDSLKDGYGDASDWIELRNTGNRTVDLTGWGLSDDSSEPMKWTFPEIVMAPHSTMIVFASKNDVSIDPEGMLHADFKLDDGGDSVYLTKPDRTTLADSLVNFPALDTDLAYGRDLEGDWTHMEPTPDAINSGATYESWLKPLDWSHARGFHDASFTLTVSSDHPGATILYSLDGSEPSIPYSGGLIIDETVAVRVQPVQAGYKSPPIQTKTFIFPADVIAASTMDTSITQDPAYAARIQSGLLDLPSISIVVPNAPDYPEQMCSMEILWADGQNSIQENCGVSRYGGAVAGFAKNSFLLSFRSKYGNGKLNAPLFNGFDRGVLAKTSFNKLQLFAGNHDMTTGFYMSDRFVQDSMLDMGNLNPHGRFVHVYLNGEYWGQYNCKELLDESFMANYLGGDDEDYVEVKGNRNDRTGIGWSIGVGTPPDPEPWERVRELRDDFEAVSPYLDVTHFVDIMLLWGFGLSESEFKACGPKVAGSGYKFWLNDPDRFLRDTSGDKLKNTWGPGYIWTALLGEDHPDFKMLLADRIYRNFFNNGAMTAGACDARLLARMDEIRDSFLLEAARWGYLSPTNWESKAANIRANMFPYRAGELVAHWRGYGWLPSFDPPSFDQYGGAVLAGFQPTLTSSDGTIYYTLDGTDPRLPGGGLSPVAIVWTAGAVTVAEDITITTRVRKSSGEWSALAEPLFLIGSRQSPEPGDLVITEINYNPNGSDDYEFIEIWNRSDHLIDLSGVYLDDGVSYIFAEFTTLYPGAHTVVVEDAAAFSSRYQDAASPWYWDGVSVAGEWVGGLSNDGERLAILSVDDTLLTAVDYRTDRDWPEPPDGDGNSLELSVPSSVPLDAAERFAYLNEGSHWKSSSRYHGSPGRFDSGSIDVVINEVLSHTDVGVDWIEFYNFGNSAADLSNLAITDKLDQPSRYRIPGGTSIDANEFLVVSAADLGFGFSELGSSAYLLELAGDSIVRIVDQVSFPAAAREEPFGRHQRSDGIVDFTELAAVTPGAVNAPPRIGSVVISEIMFNPDLGRSEYVELINRSGSTVPLYAPSIPANTWAFSGVGDFVFPEGTELAPNETAIVSATTPTIFRSQYQLDESVQVFGPWTGGLDAEGEKLELLSPGDPEPDGFVPMYRADHVSYRTTELWPTTEIAGVSLERSPLDSYGSDPINWLASPRTGTSGFVIGDTFDMGAQVAFSGSAPKLSFYAFEGESYRVLYKDSLSDPDWLLLEALPNIGVDWIEVTDPNPPEEGRFYRIVWDR
ncbi:MAG: lamin tail domain-containing protein [Opitutaceae bacterium]